MISASATEHFVKSPEDLKSKNVAVLCGTSTEQWVKANNVARTVVCAQNMVDAVDLVKKELVDAALGWADELLYHASHDCKVEVSSIAMHATEFSFPVARRDNVPSWRYRFNAALFKLRETGEFHKLRQKWFRVGHTTCGPSGSETNPDKAQIQLANIIGLAVILVVGLLAGGLIEVVKSAKMIGKQLVEARAKRAAEQSGEPAKQDSGGETAEINSECDPQFKDPGDNSDESEGLLKPDGPEEDENESRESDLT